MQNRAVKEKFSLMGFLKDPRNRLMLVFTLEGILFQFSTSIKGFGNNLFATNLGATDTQIALIQTVGCLVTLAMLIPVGVISDMRKSTKTVPLVLLFMCSATFVLQSLVPSMGGARITMFFVVIGLSSGMFGSFNSQWQAMFGDLVEAGDRNRVLAMRNRVMAVVGVIVPMLCGLAMTRTTSEEERLTVLSIFFFAAGIMILIQAFVVMRIPGGQRSKEQLDAIDRFSFKNVGDAIAEALKHKPFRSFVFAALLLYTCYQIDWSTWYIAQRQYVMLTDTHMSFYTAICCVAQIFSLGYIARLNNKKSVHFSICLGVGALVFSPVVMLFITSLPVGARPTVFMCVCVFQNMIECGIPMCMVQMLLEVVPVKHRSLTVSLYTVMITISNSVFPLLGVKIYTALGANLSALRIYYVCLAIWRAGVTLFFIYRFIKMKREGRIVLPKASETSD